MFAYVASVTLHEHFMNALNAENVSVNLEKAKTTISLLGFLPLFFFFLLPCKVLFWIVYLSKIKLSQFSSILQLLFINLNVHCLNRGPKCFRHVLIILWWLKFVLIQAYKVDF